MLYESLGIDFAITSSVKNFEDYSGAKINYSGENFANCVTIKAHSILYDHGIKDYHLEVLSHEKFKKIFFKNSNETIPFDLFGASFWLISRYEEYLPYKADQFNRFQYKSSLAYQYGFLDEPLVNLWLWELKKVLLLRYPQLVVRERTYNFISSIDIDNVYKYKFKGFIRTLAGLLSDGSFSKIKLRLRIILNRAKDPFDCYDFLIKTHLEHQTKAIYFLLLGDYGPNDKNHSASDLRFQSLIKHLSDYSIVGIHPSFGSNASLRQLKVEVSRLSNITHRIITKSRQHFSVLKFPKTYLDLIQAGIESDFSMGYTNHNGFRASFCYPYKWYMLENESVSPLTIHPFCISENSLIHESKEQETTLEVLAKSYVDQVKEYGGQLISIFHNDTFGNKIKKFYLEFLEMVK